MTAAGYSIISPCDESAGMRDILPTHQGAASDPHCCKGGTSIYIDTPIAFLTFTVARNGFRDTFVQLLVAVTVVGYNSLVQ